MHCEFISSDRSSLRYGVLLYIQQHPTFWDFHLRRSWGHLLLFVLFLDYLNDLSDLNDLNDINDLSWFPFVGAYFRSFSGNFFHLLSLPLRSLSDIHIIGGKDSNSLGTCILRTTCVCWLQWHTKQLLSELLLQNCTVYESLILNGQWLPSVSLRPPNDMAFPGISLNYPKALA